MLAFKGTAVGVLDNWALVLAGVGVDIALDVVEVVQAGDSLTVVGMFRSVIVASVVVS